MRIAIVVNGEGIPVFGMVGHVDRLRALVTDRVAAGDAADGEQVVRLPRCCTRTPLDAARTLFDLRGHIPLYCGAPDPRGWPRQLRVAA